MLKKKNLIFLGAPGAGKGTFSDVLQSREGIVHISTGDLLRAEIAAGSELGKQAASLIKQGQLVPDDIVGGMVAAKLATPKCEDKGFILDGFPRNIAQAEMLNKLLEEQGKEVDAVICFDVPEEVIVKRLSGRLNCKCGGVFNKFYFPPQQAGLCDKCGADLFQRPDDNPDTVRERLGVYQAKTMPLIDFYRNAGLLISITETDRDKIIEALYRELT